MFTFLKPLTCVAALCLLPALPLGAETQAQVIKANFVEDVGASERINFSGKLRMLSQRIASASCYASSGTAMPASADQLTAAVDEFELILSGLQFGEETLNIKGEETDRKVLGRIEAVRGVWNPMHAALSDAIAARDYNAAVSITAQKNEDLLSAAKLLVSELVGEYSDPTALLQADAITIDIAGRQRMLAQRISKKACLISIGKDGDGAMEQLDKARSLYDASANALRFGMPAAGITATTNADILAGLDEVLTLWADVQPILDQVKQDHAMGEEDKAFLFPAMNKLTGKMNVLVGKYNEESKLGL